MWWPCPTSGCRDGLLYVNRPARNAGGGMLWQERSPASLHSCSMEYQTPLPGFIQHRQEWPGRVCKSMVGLSTSSSTQASPLSASYHNLGLNGSRFFFLPGNRGPHGAPERGIRIEPRVEDPRFICGRGRSELDKAQARPVESGFCLGCRLLVAATMPCSP